MDESEALKSFLKNQQLFEANFARNIARSFQVPVEDLTIPPGGYSIGRTMTPAERAGRTTFKQGSPLNDPNWRIAPTGGLGYKATRSSFQEELDQIARDMLAETRRQEEVILLPEPVSVKEPEPSRHKRLLR